MALVAVNAVVHIPLHALVIRVRLGLRVAVRALEDRVVIRIRVTRGAHVIRVPVTGRELRVLRVIEGRVQPVRGAVAILTSRREELRLGLMSGIGGVVVVRLVAANARRRERRVVAVDVAVRTLPWRNGMRAGQRECRVVMVER